MRRTGRAGQMVNFINLNVQGINDIMVEKFKVLMAYPLFNVSSATGKVVVSNKHLNKNNCQLKQQQLFIDEIGRPVSSSNLVELIWRVLYCEIGHLMTIHHQSVHKMRSNKPCSSSHQDPFSIFICSEFYFRKLT